MNGTDMVTYQSNTISYVNKFFDGSQIEKPLTMENLQLDIAYYLSDPR
jgi:hypothetical protein